MKLPQLVPVPNVLVKIVPALGVHHDLHLGSLLPRVHAAQPVVEEGRIRNRCGQRDEGARDELHGVLPLHTAFLLSDAVNLIEDHIAQSLHPVLVRRRKQQHLQNVRHRHQHLAVLPLAGLHDSSRRVVLLEEDAEQLVLGVRRVGLAGETGVDLSADLVDQSLRGRNVHGDAFVVRAENLVHDVVTDESLAAGSGSNHQGRALVIDDIKQVLLPPIRLEVDSGQGVLGGADTPGHVWTHVHQLESELVWTNA
mmetsp:Transcript_59948/g.97037  ORF Transcript_59948/g.97037 Transcript_59948/m.97037 type:complete len:253 (+) Transcript_59948:2473-3231(+)